MKLGYIIMYVEDVEKTVRFYEKAFGLLLTFFHEEKQYAEMDTGETTLAFASEELALSNGLTCHKNRISHTHAGFEIAFVTDDVIAAFEKALQTGAKAIVHPVQKPWGQIVAYVADNNGILVELCSPLGITNSD